MDAETTRDLRARIAALEARVADLEADRAALRDLVVAMGGVLDRARPDEAAEDARAAPGPVPQDEADDAADPADLVDAVWDAFAFNADAYAFWHGERADLGGMAPAEAARTKRGAAKVRALLARLGDGADPGR